MEKTVRKKELDKFRDGKVKYLITTDLLSRGMDISGASVIHYHCPVTLESFRHRSGRTGRGSETGSNYIMITAKDLYRLKKIEKSCDLSFSDITISGRKNRTSSNDSNSESEDSKEPKFFDKVKQPKKAFHKKITEEKAKAEKKEKIKKKRKHSKRKGKPGAHKKSQGSQ